MPIPRGLRLSNPGNLRHGQPWDGLAAEQPDADFCSFVDLDHGCRALAKLLLGYERHFEAAGKIVCVANIVARYAPPSENDTIAYARHVAQRLSVAMTQPLDLSNPVTLCNLVKAIGRHECGREIDAGAVARGVGLALGIPAKASG
jgi:hypothetical protein